MSKEIVIDAHNALLGRLASYAAKQALLGNTVVIVNCAAAVISGNPHAIKAAYKVKRARGGSSMKGPNISRVPERLIKRAIRGMLPYRQGRGLAAFKRVRCYNAIPDAYKNASLIKAGKEKPLKTIGLQELATGL